MKNLSIPYPDKSLKGYPKDKTVYEDFADLDFYLFLEKQTFFLDVPHYHDSLEILYMIKGNTTVHINGAAHALGEGEIFICNSKMVHFYENNDENKLAIIAVLSSKFLHTFREIYSSARFPTFLRDKESNARIFELLDTWLNLPEKNIFINGAYSNLLVDLLVRLYGTVAADEENSDSTVAINFINYVHENYNKDITLESAAKHFAYSKEHFSKKFKQTIGKNFLSFVNSIRVQKAVEMLEDPNNKMTFLEVCLACGFSNTSSLYRHLKRTGYALESRNSNNNE